MFKFDSGYFTFAERNLFLKVAKQNCSVVYDKRGKKSNGGCYYYNVPCAFDIETSSFYEHDEKRACMYIWQMGLNGYCIIGREWKEFTELLDLIAEEFNLSSKCRLIIYVHNLSFEFQFMRKHLKIEQTFNLETRRPMKVLCTNGIEFRCSYLLSGLSLENVGKNLQKYRVQKLVGNLDYSLIRHSKTPLTTAEIDYALNDIRVQMAYIQECIEEEENGIADIPYTKTGYVRRYCRNECLKDMNYRHLISQLTISSAEEYNQLKRAFQGGFTHANACNVNQVNVNVACYDINSSYPFTMLSEKFPMGRGKIVKVDNKEKLYWYFKHYCCLFDITLINVRPKINYENYISLSRCDKKKTTGYLLNNGRIVYADTLTTTMTEQDFAIVLQCYTFEKIKISNFRIYEKQYLPKPFVKAIIKLYKDKTRLKDVAGEEKNYLLSKSMLNSCYGMAVMDIVRDEFTYDEQNEWSALKGNAEEQLKKENDKKNRFLFYPWGIWVCAYARRNLWKLITECSNDYLYSDTDSVYFQNLDKHLPFIEKYNKAVEIKLQIACKYHRIDFGDMSPSTIKGKSKTIGLWDFQGSYNRFKTLGAKRYLYDNNGKLCLTVAGLNKKCAMPFLIKKYGDRVFENFNEFLEIPADNTGKNTHTYIDDEKFGSVEDYLGVEGNYHELSALHLEKTEYDLFMPKQFLDYVKGIQVKKW